jgi:methylated-DNA-[protein]-cysteine S-methyltransferase
MRELSDAFTGVTIDSPLGSFHLLFEESYLVFAGFSDPGSPGMRMPAALRAQLSATPGRRSGSNSMRPVPSGIEATGAVSADTHPAYVQHVVQQLHSYFSGNNLDFEIPLKLYGSPFQQAVWNQLLRIPGGATSTYGRVAAKCGYPRAVRAVGSAVGTNPISIIVPCHRVLPAAGGVGNYGGGPEKKNFLLKLEHAIE